MSQLESPNYLNATQPITGGIPSRQRDKSRTLLKAILGILACIGLIALLIVGYVIIDARRNSEAPQKIDPGTAIESLMQGVYGKYSPSKRGWIYVGENGGTYLVTVVQQKMIETVGKDDELYIVTSGRQISHEPNVATEDILPTLYGLFKITPNGGELQHVSQPYHFSSTLPLTPERVKFNVFSEKHWGWVLKQVYENKEYQSTINEVLIAGEDEIHIAARFESAYDNTHTVRAIHGSCESANLAHSSWQAKTATKTSIEVGKKTVESQHEEFDGTDNEPLRCTKYSIAYRTDSVGDKFVTPLYLTFSGMRDGSPIGEKTLKVMFDNKSYTYLLPKEMELSDN